MMFSQEQMEELEARAVPLDERGESEAYFPLWGIVDVDDYLQKSDASRAERQQAAALEDAGAEAEAGTSDACAEGTVGAAAGGAAAAAGVAAASAMNNEVRDEAIGALTMLGFSPAPSAKVVSAILTDNPQLPVEQVVKLALKQIK